MLSAEFVNRLSLEPSPSQLLRTMSDYYWPLRKPTARLMDYITQMRYSVHPFNDEICEIKAVNFYHPVQTLKHHAFIPAFYYNHLLRFLWKYYLFIKLYTKFKNRKSEHYTHFYPTLGLMIVHLDNVIESLIRPCQDFSQDFLGSFRSANFNEYLITEFLISSHDPLSVNRFRSRCPVNIERMSLDNLGARKQRISSANTNVN